MRPAPDSPRWPASLRVLLVNGNFENGTVGGTQTFTRNLADALVEDGHTVAVLCQGDRDGEERMGNLRVFRVRPFRLSGDWHWVALVNQCLAIQNPAVATKVARVLDDFRPDLCHVQMLRRLTPAVLGLLRRRPQTAVVQTVHEQFSRWDFNAFLPEGNPDKLYTKPPLVVSLFKRYHRRLSATVDHVCAPSNSALAPYLADGYFQGVPRTIVANSVPFEWGDPPSAAKQRLSNRTVGDARTQFVFIGRLDHYKGVRTLLDAFRGFDEPAARLDIAGDGVLADDVAQHASRDPRITFHGAVEGEQRSNLLSDADVLVCPSTWPEAFGLVVLEAYAAGLPVIVARSGALPELVRDEESGLIVNAGSSDALAAAMRRLLDPAVRHRMGRGAAACSLSFRPGKFLTQQIAVYHQALAAVVGPREATRRGPGRP